MGRSVEGGIPARMRAARITAPGEVRVEEVRTPDFGPGDVLLRVEGCGVCASNLGPWKGLPWLKYPLGPGEGGHEPWGVVVAAGEGVPESWLGRRVTGLGYRSFAEYDRVAADTLVPIDERWGDRPLPGEAYGCAMNIFRRSAIHEGETVAVVGVGFLGSLLVQLAERAGARVIAITRRPFAQEMARRMGADAVIPMDDHHGIIRQVMALTDDAGCDRVIEATGHQWPLDLSAELCRERGTLIIAGYHQDGPRQVNMQLWNWRGLDVINAHERDPQVYTAGIAAALDAIGSGLDVDSLVTHQLSLDELGRALALTADRPAGFMKAVVIP